MLGTYAACRYEGALCRAPQHRTARISPRIASAWTDWSDPYVTHAVFPRARLADGRLWQRFGTMMAQPGDDAAKDMQERDEALWEQNKK